MSDDFTLVVALICPSMVAEKCPADIVAMEQILTIGRVLCYTIMGTLRMSSMTGLVNELYRMLMKLQELIRHWKTLL